MPQLASTNVPYRIAPGARVLLRGDGTVDLYPPGGFAVRPVRAGRAILPLLEHLDQPMRLDEMAKVLRSGGGRAVSMPSVEVLARFGIIRALREPVPRPRSIRSGFLVFALGEPRFARLASNAALTLRARVPDCEIALVHDQTSIDGLSDARLALFDHLVDCPESFRTVDGRFTPLLAKLHVDRLTPFDCTIVFDADTVFLPDADMASELGRYCGCEFAPTATFTHLPGRTEPGDRIILWAAVDECIERFGVESALVQCHLYYFAFRRCTATSALMAKARAVFLELSERPLSSMQAWHESSVSAELALSIATGLVDTRNYSGNHVPVMNNLMEVFDGVWRHYLGVTFCGEPPTRSWQYVYDRVAEAAATESASPCRWAELDA